MILRWYSNRSTKQPMYPESPHYNQGLDRVPLVTTYNPRLPNLNKITRNYLPVLHVSEALMTAYRRPKNLRDLLVRAELKSITEDTRLNGNSPCNVRRCCKTCQHVRAEDRFRSTVTGQSYRVHTPATCKTKNLVYLIECSRHSKQYVGETENALHIHLNGHRSDIRTKKTDKPVAEHFNSRGHSMEDLTITVTET